MAKLSEQEKSHIRELATHVEGRTGVQVLAVVTGKSDAYHEVPWKAFSLGAALATLVLAAVRPLGLTWDSMWPLLLGSGVLGAGLVLSLASIFLQPVSRSFISKQRATEETRQFAQSLFLEQGLSRTRSRRAVLILASQFERRAAVVADTGIIDRIPHAELENIATAVDAALALGSTSAALARGLSALEELLLRRGFASTDAEDRVAEEFLETEGPKP